MWPERIFPERHWPQKYWAIPNNYVRYLRSLVRTRRFLEERWFITLISSTGTRYELGYTDIEDDIASSIAVPGSIPDGTYTVEVKTTGLAWENLVQKKTATVTIDSGSSTPITDGLPLFTNFRYDIHEGWIRLLWDGDVPLLELTAGSVSAGIWLSNGVPNFSTTPTVTIPLFSWQTEHQYLIRRNETAEDKLESMYWLERFWIINHWVEQHWLYTRAFNYAGLAAISSAGVQGPGQYISLPDRTVVIPSAIVKQG